MYLTENPQDLNFNQPMNPIGCLVAVIITLIVCALLGSCKVPQSTIGERVVYDTIWTEKAQQSAKNDSIVYRERIVVQPHVIKVGDTTIVYSDTTIVRVAENNHYITRNVYQDKGQIIRDTAYRKEIQYVPQTKVMTTPTYKNKWQLFWFGIIVGVLIALVIKFRRNITTFIRRILKFVS